MTVKGIARPTLMASTSAGPIFISSEMPASFSKALRCSSPRFLNIRLWLNLSWMIPFELVEMALFSNPAAAHSSLALTVYHNIL
ncbi:hypothetical protein EMCRGX_G033739 [Ephydatia muelleri]